MIDNISAEGKIELKQVRNKKTIKHIQYPNTVVTLGKESIARRVVSGAYANIEPFNWLSLGIGSNTITAGDTTLGSEYLKYGLGNITGSTYTTTTTNDTAWWIGSFGIDTSKTINEAGIFNASGLDTGNMLSRTCFADVATVSGDTVILDWKVKFA
jgi:hypothetical protein